MVPMAKTVIKVDNLSKQYRLGQIGGGTLRDDVNRWIARLMGRPDPLAKIGQEGAAHARNESFWALKDVNFEVKEGEILGIIGRNGAGKSTLLKILSRITTPTEGRITMRGRVGSLLEVGTGFHPELTGRENIYLNGTILGMRKAEVDRKLEEIIAFAEMERFVDTPVKRYSSGMTVRLAFAVAAHLEPEILIVDEVLAVGDAEFQAKCLGKMKDVSSQGRTVLFVSHNMGSIVDLCQRGLVVESGRLIFDGEVGAAVTCYMEKGVSHRKEITADDFSGLLRDRILIESVRINDIDVGAAPLVNPLETITVEVLGTSKAQLSNMDLFVTVYKDGVRLFTLFDQKQWGYLEQGAFRSVFTLPDKVLRPGHYTVRVGGDRKGGFEWLLSGDIGRFEIMDMYSDGFEARAHGIFNFPRTGMRLQVRKDQ